jgi:hypothetical protein
MGVYLNHQGVVKYLTGSKIAELLQSITKTCHPDLTKEEILRFSSHSGRVWAVVLLDEAGMNPDFIKSRLRWLGDSYRLYLRDTAVLQLKHIAALEQSSFEFISLYGEYCTTLPDIVPEDDSMGIYTKKLNVNVVSFFFFCMPAIHSGAAVLKTKLHLVYVLPFVVL